jgi:hypothetical protein
LKSVKKYRSRGIRTDSSFMREGPVFSLVAGAL